MNSKHHQSDNVILITGASKRLGRAMALAAADRGCDVAVHYRSGQTEAEEVAKIITNSGVNTGMFQAELTDDAQVNTMFDDIETRLGSVRYLINSASVFTPSPLMDTAPYELDHFLSVNLTAQYRVIRQYVQRFSGNDGAMVNMLDWRAWKPDPWFLAYNISKASFMNLTTNLAVDLAPKIRVNGIAPGTILPAEHSGRDSESQIRDLPINRWGSPEEVAAAAMFLLLDGQYVTGQILSVDGGKHLV